MRVRGHSGAACANAGDWGAMLLACVACLWAALLYSHEG